MQLPMRPRCGLVLATSLLLTSAAASADDLWQALSSGKPDLYLRYRFEQVEDGQKPALKDAYANTLRTALGYTTGLFHGVGGYVQLEDVRVVDNEAFNDGGSNGVKQRAVVVDPQGTEIQQANLRFRGVPRTTFWFGRQEIEHRQAPLHRYVGNILWRQNWQSFDGLRVVNESLAATKIDYAYIWNVNRIFGEDNPLPDRANYRIDGHLINIQYSGFQYAKLEPYAYLLDFDSKFSARLSTATYGLRVQGVYDLIGHASKLLYTAEYARQQDYRSNPKDIDVGYYLAEAGLTKLLMSPLVEAVTLKLSYEVLESDGHGNSFQTPLGTNHAFQGWADRFLTTPADGIQDLYGTVVVKGGPTQLMLSYHDFAANRHDYDYGGEWNVQLTRLFHEHYTVGVKYAAYAADQNALNLARNGLASAGKQAYDLDKFWLWLEFKI